MCARLARLLICTLLLLPAAAIAQDTSTWSWKGTVRAGGTLSIHGVLGDIHAVRAAGGTIAVRADRRARRSDPESVDIVVRQTEDGVTICAVYPTPEDADHENACDARSRHGQSVDHNDVHVDFTVEVPDDVRLEANTVVGDVVAEDIHSDVDAATVTGKVDVGATGAVSARSVSGSIVARMGALRPNDDVSFQTVSGTITLELPRNLNADVELRSQFGNVDSDFDMVTRATRFGHAVRGTIGRGGPHIAASTLSGRIRLRRAP